MMKMTMRRIGAILMTLVMFATMLPTIPLTVSAAGTLTVADANIGLSWTDASDSSGKAAWSASGDTITGTATGYKWLSVISRTINTKLTIKNNYADARTLSFNYSLSGGGSVSGTISGTSGSYSAELAGGASTTITLTSPSGTSTNTLTITNIKLVGNSNVTATFVPGENGSYTVGGTGITAETSYEKEPNASTYTVVATPNSGYSFYGWYNETAGNYMSYDESATLSVTNNATIKPVFVIGTPAHFGVGANRYINLSEAITAAQSGSVKTIVVLKDGIVSGSHTIPSGVTLLVPFNASHTMFGAAEPGGLLSNPASPACVGRTWTKPTAFCTLTMGADARITVNGSIEVGGRHAAAGGDTAKYGGTPSGPLGFINMLEGSHIDLNNGANLYCWGYIYGNGTITAKSGSNVYENFQLEDFRGGSKSTEMTNNKMVFLNNQYYVQNIEVATTYESGSTEYVLTSANVYTDASALIKFIGSGALFQPANGAYVIKDYDPSKDELNLSAYGDCTLAALSISLSTITVDSKEYVLPITNNININIKSGTATLKQDVMMLPGSSLTVDEGATVVLETNTSGKKPKALQNSGYYVAQLFTANNYFWGYKRNDDGSSGAKVTGTYFIHSNDHMDLTKDPHVPNGKPKPRLHLIPFTCADLTKTRYYRPIGTTESDLEDVTLDINGTVIANGYVYTTVAEDGHGANVISSEGTGRFVMNSGAGTEPWAVLHEQDTYNSDINIPLTSVMLKNGDKSYTTTVGATAGTVYVYCAACDKWYKSACCTHEGHTYDNDQDADCNVCGAVRLIHYDLFAIEAPATGVSENTGNGVGVAVLFTIDANGVLVDAKNIGDISNATVSPNSLALNKKVLRIGAVVSNNTPEPNLDQVSNAQGSQIIDIEAVKIYDTTGDMASFAIRVINIPANEANLNTLIYFRPYYIYEGDNGVQTTIYGDVVAQSYNGALAASQA